MAGHYQLFARFLHSFPTLWFHLQLVVFQNGLCRLLAGPFHHSFDSQVVNIEGSEADINGRIDSMVCGLSCSRPVPSSEVRLGERSEQQATNTRIWGEQMNVPCKENKDAMQRGNR